MQQITFLFFEVMIFLLFGVCLWHAAQQSGSKISELFFALLFGVFLEWMTIWQLGAYQYGQFLVMIDGAPLCIGLGWAVIIYSGMEAVEVWKMPNYARPFLVGFYALNLDIVLDTIAIRQGFWDWAIPLDSQWFGVPWGNFWAWFIVVTSYSGLLYWLRGAGLAEARQRWLRWLYPLAALIGAVIILALTNAMFVSAFVHSELVSALSMFVLLWVGAVIVYVTRPRLETDAFPNVLMLLPAILIHTYTNVMGFAGGFYQEIPALAVIGLSMFAISLGFTFYPWLNRRAERKNLPS